MLHFRLLENISHTDVLLISITDSHVCCHSHHKTEDPDIPQQMCLEACKTVLDVHVHRKSYASYNHTGRKLTLQLWHLDFTLKCYDLFSCSYSLYITTPKKHIQLQLSSINKELKSRSKGLIRSQLWLNTTKTAAWTAHMPNKQLTISCCSASRSWKSKPTCHQLPPRSEGSQPQMKWGSGGSTSKQRQRTAEPAK